MGEPALDVIAIGRVSVDLYGQQVGGRLEDMASFAKYVGGCPANVAIGAARLGLRAALLSRVGDEPLGRFVREQLVREGVDVRGLATDPGRLTALAILGIRDPETFPLVFYRERCADMALCEADVDEAFVASARAVVVTGTHFTTPTVAAASRRAMRLARRHGREVVLDLDYRPVLWGLAGHGQGESRFAESAEVTARLQELLPECDVVVGTEEEVRIAGGSRATRDALARLREVCGALLVLKRGPEGAIAFPGGIPARLEQGVVAPGFPVEVYNAIGAGDAFLAGFLRGHLRGEPLAEACRLGNACGALVVSRHGCSPASPTWAELRHFLTRGSPHRALREDPELEHLHRATTRRRDWPEVCALAFDHRAQLERMAERAGQPAARIAAFKRLAYRAAREAAGSDPALGILVDDRYGRAVLDAASGEGIFVARPIERPETTPLAFEGGPDVGLTLREWPVDHVVKCLVRWQPGDPEEIAREQARQLQLLGDACRRTEHELLLELIADRERPGDVNATLAVLGRIYELGLRPEWWKLAAPEGRGGWERLEAAIRERDPHCRGVLVLGADAPEAELARALAEAARQPLCRGFAIGRTVFGEAAEAWLAGRIGDEEAVAEMTARHRRLLGAWREARGGAGAAPARSSDPPRPSAGQELG
jgi:5-dehydro-2-deoxygluconokinase